MISVVAILMFVYGDFRPATTGQSERKEDGFPFVRFFCAQNYEDVKIKKTRIFVRVSELVSGVTPKRRIISNQLLRPFASRVKTNFNRSQKERYEKTLPLCPLPDKFGQVLDDETIAAISLRSDSQTDTANAPVRIGNKMSRQSKIW